MQSIRSCSQFVRKLTWKGANRSTEFRAGEILSFRNFQSPDCVRMISLIEKDHNDFGNVPRIIIYE